MKIEHLFVDLLDGKWSLGYNDGYESQTIGIFEEDYEDWLYPDDLSLYGVPMDNVINVFRESLEEKFQFNIYSLPDNWRDIVTNNSGKDGKKSIHDIMIDIT